MITARIDSQHFILKSAQDGEQLLKIFANAKPVENAFDRTYRGYFYPDTGRDVSVEISAKELVTLEEHQRRKAERDEQDAATRASAKALATAGTATDPT
jgi:hypothetical protein